MSIEYASNDYVDQYRELNLFHKEYVVEELLNTFIRYTDMKNKYPIQVIDLRCHVDYINARKIQFFEEFRGATNSARLFMILVRHRNMKMISDGKKLLNLPLFKAIILNLKDFMESINQKKLPRPKVNYKEFKNI